jgi:hypothetical protein
MKTILRTAGLVTLIVLGFISGCKPDEPSAEELFLEKISGNWTATMVSVDNTVLEGAFDGFALTLKADKTYTSTNGNAPIWPASGTFTAKAVTSSAGFNLVRSDGVEVEVVELTENDLTLRMHYISPDGRSSSVSGDYEFELTK